LGERYSTWLRMECQGTIQSEWPGCQQGMREHSNLPPHPLKAYFPPVSISERMV